MTILADKSDTAQQTKTEITPERAEYVRSNMDKSIEDLQDETGFSEYVIRVIEEAKENGFYRSKTGATTKYELLTDEMIEYMLGLEFDTWTELRKKFNHRFRMSDLTPMNQQTLMKYLRKLKAGK